jgi:hypothetical protein
MVAPKKQTVDASKKDREHPTGTFAKGGKGTPNKMLEEAPAEAAPAGRTGPTRTKAPGAISARGGPKNIGYGLSLPAVGGHTAPVRLGKGR